MVSLAPSAGVWHQQRTKPKGRLLPAVSVIMPIHNRARQVGRAIESVQAQTFTDWELIAVDDGSTDDSAAVVASYGDPRIQLLRLPQNRGGNAARNRGIDEARAPLLAFLDSDDLFLPMKLAEAVKWFTDHPDRDVLIDSFRKVYPDARKPSLDLRNPALDDNRAILEALFTRRIWKATPGIIVRRETAIRAGKFDEALKRRQDFDFLLRLANVGRLASIDQIWWVKNYSEDAISAGLGNFVPSLLDFHQRHPEYSCDPIFREGLAHDIGRHFARLLRKGKLGRARKDASALAAEFGWGATLSLAASGFVRFRRRRANVPTG